MSISKSKNRDKSQGREKTTQRAQIDAASDAAAIRLKGFNAGAEGCTKAHNAKAKSIAKGVELGTKAMDYMLEAVLVCMDGQGVGHGLEEFERFCKDFTQRINENRDDIARKLGCVQSLTHKRKDKPHLKRWNICDGFRTDKSLALSCFADPEKEWEGMNPAYTANDQEVIDGDKKAGDLRGSGVLQKQRRKQRVAGKEKELDSQSLLLKLFGDYARALGVALDKVEVDKRTDLAFALLSLGTNLRKSMKSNEDFTKDTLKMQASFIDAIKGMQIDTKARAAKAEISDAARNKKADEDVAKIAASAKENTKAVAVLEAAKTKPAPAAKTG